MVDAELYAAVCAKVWKSLCEKYKGPHALVLQEDNAPAHTAKKARAQLQHIPTLVSEFGQKWPACSPDLSPIENLWAWLDREAKQQLHKNIAAVKCEVDRLLETQECKDTIVTLLDGFAKRLARCVALEGANTQNTDAKREAALPAHLRRSKRVQNRLRKAEKEAQKALLAAPA
jgi:transposase